VCLLAAAGVSGLPIAGNKPLLIAGKPHLAVAGQFGGSSSPTVTVDAVPRYTLRDTNDKGDPERYIKDAPPRVIDVHVHFPSGGLQGQDAFPPDTMVDMLAYTARVLNISKIVLLGRPGEGNDLALKARDRFPDLFLPMAWVRLDEDSGETILDFKRRGFVGLKFHSSKRDYDDESYYPIYQAAEESRLVCLFHTGIAGGMVDYLQYPPRQPRKESEFEREMRQRRRGSGGTVEAGQQRQRLPRVLEHYGLGQWVQFVRLSTNVVAAIHRHPWFRPGEGRPGHRRVNHAAL